RVSPDRGLVRHRGRLHARWRPGGGGPARRLYHRVPAARRDVRHPHRSRVDVPRGIPGRDLCRSRRRRRRASGVAMSEDTKAVNPHRGRPLPEEPAIPKPRGGTPGAAAAGAGLAAAARQSGPPQLSSMPSAQELAVRSVLETVMDPELGLSVIDLGLIREVHFLTGRTLVRMMLTTPFCPYAPQMMAEVKQAAESPVPQPPGAEIL